MSGLISCHVFHGGPYGVPVEQNEYMIMHHIEQNYWWFAGRRFLIHEILKDVLKTGTSQNTILDIGCGTGMNLEFLKDYGKVYGLDIAPKALQLAKGRGLDRLTRSDINVSIPFKNDMFDVVTCMDVLEHLDHERTAIEEIFRICKPGKFVIFTVPAFNIHWSPHDVAVHHKRRYTRQLLLERVTGLDWNIQKSSYYNTSLFLPILVVRKFKEFFVEKKDIPKSDFFMRLPRFLNSFLTAIMKSEIKCLKTLTFPFGVSLFLVLQKRDD